VLIQLSDTLLQIMHFNVM